MAWQLAEAFSLEVLRILDASAAASADLRFRRRVLDAASAVPKDITEGFLRYSPSASLQFLDSGLGSLGDAEQRLKDGLARGYYAERDCTDAFRLARRCLTCMIRLKQSQRRYLEHKAARARPRPDSW